MKRATFQSAPAVALANYFNPRPREEGDVWLGRLGKPKIISIHALVKRATLDIIDKDILDLISIHALVKRATTCIKRHIKKISLFQSTPS